MKLFFTNYHISVNKTLVDDLLSIGLDVVLPDRGWEKTHIDFFAPNDEHITNGARLISYDSFINDPDPYIILIPCIQLVDDFLRFYELREKRDVLVFLTANSNAVDVFPKGICDYLISHDLYYHREFTGKYKMLYFNRPTLYIEKKTEQELVDSFNGRKINIYINNFDKDGFEPEYECALEFREKWQNLTGHRIPFYGYGMPDGWPKPWEVQKHMVNSMFTICFKRRETWGQMINESMLLGTPGIFLNQFKHSTFTQYLINDDTAICGDTVDELIEKIDNLTFPQYQSLVNEAYSQSEMFCNDEIRRNKLAWLFDKVSRDERMNKN